LVALYFLDTSDFVSHNPGISIGAGLVATSVAEPLALPWAAMGVVAPLYLGKQFIAGGAAEEGALVSSYAPLNQSPTSPKIPALAFIESANTTTIPFIVLFFGFAFRIFSNTKRRGGRQYRNL
jgi:hypothetical protein